MQAAHVTLIPRKSEKAYYSALQNAYVFIVPKTANKNDIAAAVAKQYDVAVVAVNVVVAKGKTTRSIRKGRPVAGKHADIKKAYVTLAEGDSIKLFEEEKK